MIQYGIYLLLVVASIISTLVLRLISKNKINVRVIIGFYFDYYFIFSALKCYIEGPELTLFQSFWEVDTRTYIHYGMPLMAIAIIAPVILWVVFKKNLISIFDWASSLLLIVFLSIGLIFDKITNICFLAAFVLIFILSFVAGGILKKELIFIESNDIKKYIREYWVIDLLPIFLIFFYYPNELYFANKSEFSNQYLPFIIILLMGMVIFYALLLVTISVLPKNWIEPFQAVVFAVALCFYLQATFFNGGMQEMSGGSQDWNATITNINIIIWIAIMIVSLVCLKRIKSYKKIATYVSAFIVIFLSVTWITLIVQNLTSLSVSRSELTTDGELILASDDNVVVFVLDMFDARVMEGIAEGNSGFIDPLHDFTFYNNTVSRYIMTTFAIPHLLTGADWRNQYDGVWYNKYAYEGDDTFLAKLYNNGIDIGVYTEGNLIGDSHRPYIRNYEENVLQKSDILATLTTMKRTSLYTTMPFIVKNNYNYYSGDIRHMVKSGDVWDASNDVPFYEDIVCKGIIIDENLNGAFRFYHMRGAHDPYYLSEDIKVDNTHTIATSTSQAKGALKIVYKYLEEMKKEGVYDNSTIIITADHGYAAWYDKEQGGMVDASMPLLMVKKASQTGEVLTYNSAPVNQIEILSTILDAYGMEYTDFGLRLEDIDEGVIREREFGYARPGNGVLKGRVVGDAHNLDNWIVDETIDIDVLYY